MNYHEDCPELNHSDNIVIDIGVNLEYTVADATVPSTASSGVLPVLTVVDQDGCQVVSCIMVESRGRCSHFEELLHCYFLQQVFSGLWV